MWPSTRRPTSRPPSPCQPTLPSPLGSERAFTVAQLCGTPADEHMDAGTAPGPKLQPRVGRGFGVPGSSRVVPLQGGSVRPIWAVPALGDFPADGHGRKPPRRSDGPRCSPMSNQRMRCVSTSTAANGAAFITSATRFPAIHCCLTSNASWPRMVAVTASACPRKSSIALDDLAASVSDTTAGQKPEMPKPQ